jgi:16S rRNA (adenine1518-N6/adenine1519-N6)-dimethyltransferase
VTTTEAETKPKKQLGQNFLIDSQVVNDLLDAAEINNRSTVLEVGAGTGAVTRPLAERAGKVIAVEFDKDLIPKLKTNLEGLKNVKIINEDILKIDTSHQLLATNFKVVGSIPYQITSPLIHKLLKDTPQPKSITIVVQREVAEKIAARPPRASYLSNFVANFGQAKIIRTVKSSAFHPQPKIESAIVHIVVHPKPRVPDPKFEAFLHRGFAQPRKMLNKRFNVEKLREAEIDHTGRPQTLRFDEWIKLFMSTRGADASSKATLSRRRPNSAE